MLKRKIAEQLVAWKADRTRKSLVVKGARQVGKTYSINLFARENYKSYIYINFEETPSLKRIFEGDLDTTTIIKQITLNIPNANIIPGDTIIFLDEIQSCPGARTALKFMTMDERFDVIASGSLLGINYADVSSFPVGYTNQIQMHSLDFEEFLWASSIPTSAIDDLRDYYEQRKAVPPATHERMMQLFKEYIVVGGMPAVVSSFIENNNFAEVLQIQRAIVNDYLDDIAKYAKDTEKAKARACFLSVPRQLAKDYKKFQYSVVEKGGSSRKYAGCLMWLYDAGIVNFCYNLSRPELPLEGYSRTDVFKVYMNDTGLLMSMLEDGSQADIISGNLGIYKGAIFENIIADIFTKAGKRLYYFENKGEIEIDFFIRYAGAATAVEVKSSENKKSKSMKSIMENYGVSRGIRLSSKNVGTKATCYSTKNSHENIQPSAIFAEHDKDWCTLDSLPLYMSIFI